MEHKRTTKEHICRSCGKPFVYRCKNKWEPNYCYYCYKEKKGIHQQEKEKTNKQREADKWKKQNAIEKRKFENMLEKMCSVSIDEIQGKGETLYIIGNGFDLMHGVKSSYGAFRDTLGARNELRVTLEGHLKSESIWSDFEEALGHINFAIMADPEVVENMLEISGFFEEDSGYAEYYLAIEWAAEAMRVISSELDRRFRKWVETLKIGTEDRPLKGLFRNGKVLCFNYTEFVEKLYGFEEPDVCYIHGCRRRKKGFPKEKLVLGHKSGATEQEYELIRPPKKARNYRDPVVEVAQQETIDLISRYDEDVTKDCANIISNHKEFFNSLTNIKDIIVVGHSLSEVDWDYFEEVARKARKAKWYFGCYGIQDLRNTQNLTSFIGVKPIVFRTDEISITPIPAQAEKTTTMHFKEVCSQDGEWRVLYNDRKLRIVGGSGEIITYIMQNSIRKCVFSPKGDVLFVITNGYNAGVPFFRNIDGKWYYVDELKNERGYYILNRRLRHAYVNDSTIQFVYNNRVIEFSLDTGVLVRNEAVRNAWIKTYAGEDVPGLRL